MSTNTARARDGSDRSSLYDDITNEIIAELEAGCVPWVQPWGIRCEGLTRYPKKTPRLGGNIPASTS